VFGQRNEYVIYPQQDLGKTRPKMGHTNGITKDRGQSTIEFTFAMIVTFILIYALVMVFRWAGLDLAERRFAHERLLQMEKDPVTGAVTRPEQQLNPEFYKPRKLEAVFRDLDLK
jgi:hypothetical protein